MASETNIEREQPVAPPQPGFCFHAQSNISSIFFSPTIFSSMFSFTLSSWQYFQIPFLLLFL